MLSWSRQCYLSWPRDFFPTNPLWPYSIMHFLVSFLSFYIWCCFMLTEVKHSVEDMQRGCELALELCLAGHWCQCPSCLECLTHCVQLGCTEQTLVVWHGEFFIHFVHHIMEWLTEEPHDLTDSQCYSLSAGCLLFRLRYQPHEKSIANTNTLWTILLLHYM